MVAQFNQFFRLGIWIGDDHLRTPTWSETNLDGRWRAYDYQKLTSRDKANLDIFWLRDDALEDSTNLPDPDVIAAGIIADLEAAMERFRGVSDALENTVTRREVKIRRNEEK